MLTTPYQFELSDGSPKRKKASGVVSNIETNNLGLDNLITLNSPTSPNPPPNSNKPVSHDNRKDSGVTTNATTSISNCTTSKRAFSNPPAIVVQVPPNPSAAVNADDPSSSNQLVVVARRKTVFISRLHPETSIVNIRNYMKSKLRDVSDNDLNIFKFKSSQERDISSFKITVPNRLFNTVVSSSFWPDDILVKEFVFRERSNVDKSVNIVTAPKN
ncbi:uncharacterized protein LOC131802430 [Musca domestica]|uniref:Uncharacterized protein LOC131802430 n=1 Tax=Musca domestica TaxID=7370 RepID=A0ABM3UYN4_MUSDO|nr:uncharacterized protein LOC131802430 [Musca domestica]